MRKFSLFVLVCTLGAVFAGCNGGSDDGTPPVKPGKVDSVVTTEKPPTPSGPKGEAKGEGK